MKTTKLLYSIFLTAVSAGCLISCGNSGDEDVTFVPFRSDEDGKSPL